MTVLASVVFGLLMVLCVVSTCICGYGHHYYVWQLLPPWKMPAGPLATVLLMLVPFYNGYWGFKSIADQGVLLEQELGQ